MNLRESKPIDRNMKIFRCLLFENIVPQQLKTFNFKN